MANFKPDQNEYKNLTPFKMWLVNQINTWGCSNFPFLESDFDKLTNYGMMMKLMKAMNEVISNENKVEEDMTNLFNAFTELQNYVNTYFDNLDVQDEINNKLDEMAESGELQEIIASYLNSKAIFAFDNVELMKQATNLIDGSYAETLGYYTINDGGSAKYKIREITNEDVVDEMFIIALHDENLIAELIIENDILNIKQIGAKGNNTDNDTSYFTNALSKMDKIYIPKGTYLISSIILTNGKILQGESWTSTVLKSINNNNENALITTVEGAMRVQILDLAINGNKTNNSTVTDGIHLFKNTSGNDTHSYIHNVRVFQCTGNGIKMSKQLESRISHCVCNNNDKNGILFVNTSDACIEDVTCSSNIENGINITTGANRIINTKCFYNGFIPESEYNERESGFYFRGANNSIVACHAQENAGHGFEIGESNQMTMSGCCADNNGLYLDENRQVINLPVGVNPLYDGVHCNKVRRSYIECAGRNFHLSNGASQRYSLCMENETECGKNTIIVSSGNQLSGDVDLNDSIETRGSSNGMLIDTIKNIRYRFIDNSTSVGEITSDNDFPLKMVLENGYVHVYGAIGFENELTNAMSELSIIKIIDTERYNIEMLNLNVVAYPTSVYSNPIGLINGRMATDGSIKVRNRGTDRGIKKLYFDFTYRPVNQLYS